MVKRDVMILDLDGTIIPYDFELEFRKLAALYCDEVISKILATIYLVFHPLIYRLYVLMLMIIVKSIGVKMKGSYFSLSLHKSYYASLLSFFYKKSSLNVNRCVYAALLDGLKRRKNVWKKVITYVKIGDGKCLLVTGNSVLPLIERIKGILKIDHVFKSYTTGLGVFVLEYELKKVRIANAIENIQRKVNAVVISDSIEDLILFSHDCYKILVKSDGSLINISVQHHATC
ncbi:MAG: hypothetical protein N3E36_05565 [Sulfolobales archaeon]|nr:hypothetical protein [Sulfolobales archaeon]